MKAKLFTYSVVAIVLFGCGLGLGRSNSNPTSIGNQSDESVIKAKIAIYDQAPIIKIDLTNVPFVGSPSAPITIVKYADFNCGHCLHASHILKQALAEYSGMIKIYYKNFPLDGNCNRLVQRKSPDSSSCIGATGALCANKQGKFYQVYSAIYDDTERNVRQTVPNILSIAKANNLNIAAFQSCLNSSEIANHIAKEVDEAEILKVQSTPTIFVNNKAIEAGTPDPAYLSALLKHISSKL